MKKESGFRGKKLQIGRWPLDIRHIGADGPRRVASGANEKGDVGVRAHFRLRGVELPVDLAAIPCGRGKRTMVAANVKLL
jgi:hypothetical protein